jgi:glycosyltransferase involved in cell wall biosynthesis/predicted O-methyltransferase YrrM
VKKIAIIVQRCHDSVVGGSEALAWQYANLLKDGYEVDILTTTAVDAATWSNALPAGLELRDGINIRRFDVDDIGPSQYQTDLLLRMAKDFQKFGNGKPGPASSGSRKHLPWTIPLQEELVRYIGPYSQSMIEFIRCNWADYRASIVVTYLYATAYFSLLEIPKGRALFVPTLHDEQQAYLSIYKHAARRAHSLIWLTDAEHKLGAALWGEVPGRIVGTAIDAKPRAPFQSHDPYLLYCGRINSQKGCRDLLDYFIRFKEQNPSPLRLVLTGKDDMPIAAHPDVDYRGFVSHEEKLRLMAGATVYSMPSPKESLSIVTLEAMAQGTPVLVNGASQVLVNHIKQSNAGRIYEDYESFVTQLKEMLSNQSMRDRMGEAGKQYVCSIYSAERIRKVLIDAVETCPEAAVTNLSGASASQASKLEHFEQKFSENLRVCEWQPHPLYNVFTQYDQEYYIERKEAFLQKYRCFYAVSKTIRPRNILELGASAGSSADAYLSAAPDASYVGLDSFGKDVHRVHQTVWDPHEIALRLFASRGFKNYELVRIDLRTLDRLPHQADLVVVDAGHDSENEYADLKLALTANPSFIFVDDADDENGAKPAIKKFVTQDLKGCVDYTFHINYVGGGVVIKLKK